MQVAGHEIDDSVIERIRCRVHDDPALTRTGLSREVAGWLGWRDARGRPRDMSCRVMLAELCRRGAIELPEARPVSFAATDPEPVTDVASVDTTLAELGPVDLIQVQSRDQSRTWRALMAHHPLGDGPLCGAQLRYLIGSRKGWLGALSFSSPALRLASREAFIGWDDAGRKAGLQQVVNNSRFLILPNVQVPNLASHVLGRIEKRLVRDWQARYGLRPVLMETFVDEAHEGTCYRAANWQEIGHTRGRGRQDRQHKAQATPKRVFVRPLSADWCKQLTGSVEPPVAWPPPEADWAECEFGRATLPDARLGARLRTLANDFYAKPCANVPQACGSRAGAKAAYRFFDHPKVGMQEVLSGHFQSTIERMHDESVVLAVQDTTSLNYTAHAATEGIGPISTRADGPQGLELHTTLAFTTTGVPLGFIDVQCWARDKEDFGKKARRHCTPIEQKESGKWLTSYKATAAAAAHNKRTQVVSVGDREADIYELFELVEQTDKGPELLVRARHNRKVEHEQQRLWPALQSEEVAAGMALKVPRRGHRKKRVARLEIRFAKVLLNPPERQSEKAPITAWAVLASEPEAPKGIKALQWMLLTTVPVTTAEDAIERLQWYAQRWQIEVFHRTLKSGCRIEDRQLGHADRIETCLAIDMVVAWRIHRLSKLGRDLPQADCSLYFEEAQWQILMSFTTKDASYPDKPPTLREAIRRVAGLGGFLGRKGDGEPGTETLWRGLQRLDDITMAYKHLIRQGMDFTQLCRSSRDGPG